MCATIHSPTPYTFNLFDRLLLLLRGRVVYFGPNGRTALDYFHTQVRVHAMRLELAEQPVHRRRWPGSLPGTAFDYARPMHGPLLSSPQCPSLLGLQQGENEAEWLVDLTTQVS